MLRRTSSRQGEVLTEEEERRLGESLQKALMSDQPNPNREGCPDPKTLRDLAFHKKIGNPEAFERATAHMAECSACVRDALGYAEEYKEHRKRRRTTRVAMALAATVVVTIAAWAVWHVQQAPRPEQIVQENPVDRSRSEPVRRGGEHQSRAPEIAQYEPVSIGLPSRWRGLAAAGDRPIVLPRGRLLVDVRLPIGSAEGKYRFRIKDKSGKAVTSGEATARTMDQVTKLKVILDTSNLSPGNHTLSVLEPGLDEWFDYPLQVNY